MVESDDSGIDLTGLAVGLYTDYEEGEELRTTLGFFI